MPTQFLFSSFNEVVNIILVSHPCLSDLETEKGDFSHHAKKNAHSHCWDKLWGQEC